MAKFNKHVEVSIIRSLKKEVVTLAASLGTVMKDSALRDPLKQADENDCMQFRFDSIRKPKMRTGQYMAIVGYEIHCWSKRGDLREDKKTDYEQILASEVDDHFQELDLNVFNVAGGDTTALLGVLQTDDSTWHFRDKRNTVFGSAVDYSLEQPTTNQAVVVVSGLFIRGA